MREAFFSAVRSVIEAMARRQPARARLRGHPLGRPRNARPDRVPRAVGARAADAAVPGARRAARAPQRWGGGRHDATSILLDPLTVEQTRELVDVAARRLDDGDGGAVAAVAERAGGNPFFAEEMARRLADESGGELFELPDTVQGLLAARLDSLEPAERTLVQHAAVVGRTFWEGALAIAGQSETGDARGAAEPPGEGHHRARRRRAARGRARVRVQARADPRRRLRDAAEGGALAEALRGRPVHRGPRGRAHRRGRRAARRALRARRDAQRRGRHRPGARPSRSTARRSTSSRPRATPPPRSTRTRRPTTTTRRRGGSSARTTPARWRA